MSNDPFVVRSTFLFPKNIRKGFEKDIYEAKIKSTLNFFYTEMKQKLKYIKIL